VCLVSWAAVAQQSPGATAAVAASNTVPRVINYSGVLRDVDGKPLSGVTGVTFLLYKDEQGGVPMWMETQNVTPDKNGRYTVTLGATASEGLLADVFANGEARWLGVQPQGGRQRSPSNRKGRQEGTVPRICGRDLYATQASLTMNVGDRVRWYLMATSNFELHAPHWHGNTVEPKAQSSLAAGMHRGSGQ
jgi:hypothetical protein